MIGDSFKGFEAVFAAIRMSAQMLIRLMILLVVLHIFVVTALVVFRTDAVFPQLDARDLCAMKTYYAAYVKASLLDPHGTSQTVQYPCEGGSSTIFAARFVDRFDTYIHTCQAYAIGRLGMIASWSALIYVLLPISLVFLARKHRSDSRDKYVRGAQIVDRTKFAKLVVSKPSGYRFKISDCVSIPESIFNRHLFVIGKPGTGKTQLSSRIIQQILDRGFKAIIHDFKGDYINQFYDYRKHYIFNPMDARHMGLRDGIQAQIEQSWELKWDDVDPSDRESLAAYLDVSRDRRGRVFGHGEELKRIEQSLQCLSNTIAPIEPGYPIGWSIFKELKSPVDIDAFCASLIPDSSSQDTFWPTSARQLLGSIIMYCLSSGDHSYRELWRVVNLGNQELLQLLRGVEGAEEGIKLLTEDKTANNIMAVLSNYTKPIKYLRGTDGDFSIGEWIRDPDPEKRVIFLSNYAMIQETIRPFLSMFVDFSSKYLCSMPDNLDRRLYFILDEFGQLSKIESMIQLLTQSRSKGGAVTILIQDVAQINRTYGKDGTASIVNSCGNSISFAVSDESTAEFISKKIGSTEIQRTEESKSMGVEDLRDSISLSRRTTEKRLVLPSEVMSLKTLNYYVQLTDLPVTKDHFEYRKYRHVSESFVEREDLLFRKKATGATGSTSGESSQVPGKEEALQYSDYLAPDPQPSCENKESEQIEAYVKSEDFKQQCARYGRADSSVNSSAATDTAEVEELPDIEEQPQNVFSDADIEDGQNTLDTETQQRREPNIW